MDQLLSIGGDSISGEAMERIRKLFHCSARILTAVEKAFGIQLEPAVIEFEFLRDVAALAAYIENRIGRTSGLKTDGQDGSANPND